MKAVDVYPISGGPTKGPLTYFSASDITPGSMVYIGVQNRKVLGIVVGSRDVLKEKSALRKSTFALKKIASNIGEGLFSGVIFNALKILATYYATSLGAVVNALVPVALLKKEFISLPPVIRNLGVKSTITYLEAPIRERVIFYKKLIREEFARGRSLIIIVPTIESSDYFHSELCKGIENFCFTHSSGNSKKEIKNLYEAILKAEHPLCIIGTIGSLFLPISTMGTMVLENEHASSYVDQQFPYLDGRVVAEAVAIARNLPLIFADTLLRIETKRFDMHGAGIGSRTERVPGTGVLIVDRNNPTDIRTDFRALSKEAMESIKEILKQNGKVFVFAFRKGYSGTIVCRDCGLGMHCPTCNRPLSLSGTEQKKNIICNVCHSTVPNTTKCARCGSWNLMPLGIGVDRVYEELSKWIPKEMLFEISGSTKKRDAQKSMTSFLENERAVLIGNESALSYLHTTVDQIIVASIDSLFSIPSYTGSERVANIIFRLAEHSKNKLILQTRYKEEPIFKALERGMLLEFTESERGIRKSLQYPPYSTLVSISVKGKETAVRNYMTRLLGEFQGYRSNILETKLPYGKISSTLFVRLTTDVWSLNALLNPNEKTKQIINTLESLPPQVQVRIGV